MLLDRPARVAFGPFELDVANGLLFEDGAPVHLRPQPLAALCLLVSKPGQLVTRAELQRAVWGPADHVDFNAGLNFCIAQLRSALRDPATRSAYLQAVPKRGYRFVAAVSDVAAAPETPAVLKAPDAVRSRRLPVTAAAIALLTALLSLGSPPREVTRARSENTAALKALIRGSAGLADAGPTDLPARLHIFDLAVTADNRLADAYAGKATALILAGNYRVQAPAAAYADAAAHAERAVALAPRLSSAHTALGMALLYSQWDWRRAGEHLRRAIALDPSSADAHRSYARYLSATGQPLDAIAEARRAVTIAPASASALTELGSALFYAGRFAEAVAACDEAAALLPAFIPARRCASAAAAEAGDYRAAMSHVAAMSRSAGAAPSLIATLSNPGTWSSAPTFWQARLQRIETSVAASACTCDEPQVAVPLAHLDRTDLALTVLEKGADQASDQLLFAGVHPAFASMRATPRFSRLLRRIGVSVP